MKFLSATLLTLSLVLFGTQSVVAGVISDGSSGVFHPATDFTLDLSGTTFPQFTDIFIDAGIRLTILSPNNGAFGDLLAANDIIVNGIIDAGSGSLGLRAGNQIVLEAGSQVIAGLLDVSAPTVSSRGTISVSGSTGSSGSGGIIGRGPVSPFPSPRGPSLISEPSTALLLLSGLALLARRYRRHLV